MSETLTGCAAASTDSTSRSTKVPVEISSVRPEPGKLRSKHPGAQNRPSILLILIWQGAVNSSRNWDTSPSVHHSSQSTIRTAG